MAKHVKKTKRVVFSLQGGFEIPSTAVIERSLTTGEVTGFKLPNGKSYLIQAALEECDEENDVYKELGGQEILDLGIIGFGDLDERSTTIT